MGKADHAEKGIKSRIGGKGLNELEQFRAKFLAFEHRLSGIAMMVNSLKQRLDQYEPSPIKEASVISMAIGLDPEITTTPIEAHKHDRAKLATELKRRGWSINRIAQGLSCCEKSVERYLKI